MELKCRNSPPKNTSSRATSLNNRIKIKFSKLPKDFFKRSTSVSESGRSSLTSRKSTYEENVPETPSFGKIRSLKSVQFES